MHITFSIDDKAERNLIFENFIRKLCITFKS